MRHRHPVIRSLILAIIVSGLGHFAALAADTPKTVVEVWPQIDAPPPVVLNRVTVDPATTAFLILDIEQLTCNPQRRPRCVASVPAIAAFLKSARAHHMPVAYSLTSRGAPDTILPGVTPLAGEPIVQSSVDKFFNTNLDTILTDKQIKTVIIVGTTAEGAVLHTATGAAMRGFKVIVPIDGMSAGTLYAEQYTAWHLVNAPGSRRHATLSRFDMIEIKP